MPLPSVNHANRLVAPYQCLEPIGFSAPSVTLIPTTPLYGLSEVKLLVVQAIILPSGDQAVPPGERVMWPSTSVSSFCSVLPKVGVLKRVPLSPKLPSLRSRCCPEHNK